MGSYAHAVCNSLVAITSVLYEWSCLPLATHVLLPSKLLKCATLFLLCCSNQSKRIPMNLRVVTNFLVYLVVTADEKNGSLCHVTQQDILPNLTWMMAITKIRRRTPFRRPIVFFCLTQPVVAESEPHQCPNAPEYWHPESTAFSTPIFISFDYRCVSPLYLIIDALDAGCGLIYLFVGPILGRQLSCRGVGCGLREGPKILN